MHGKIPLNAVSSYVIMDEYVSLMDPVMGAQHLKDIQNKTIEQLIDPLVEPSYLGRNIYDKQLMEAVVAVNTLIQYIGSRCTISDVINKRLEFVKE